MPYAFYHYRQLEENTQSQQPFTPGTGEQIYTYSITPAPLANLHLIKNGTSNEKKW